MEPEALLRAGIFPACRSNLDMSGCDSRSVNAAEPFAPLSDTVIVSLLDGVCEKANGVGFPGLTTMSMSGPIIPELIA